eukprot:gene16494-biopygen12159
MASITPEKFDSGDFVSWLRQFDCCAAANGWKDADKLKILPALLRGPAATYYHSLDGNQRGTYADLTKNLYATLCPAVDRERHFSEYEQRILRRNEDSSLFLCDFKEMLRKADTALQDDARDALLARQFMKGLPSDIRLRLLESNPTPSLHDMTSFVQRFRAINHPDVASSQYVHVVQSVSHAASPNHDDSLAASITQLTATVAPLAADQKKLRAAFTPPHGPAPPQS